MQLKPDELPEMVEGESRRVEFKLAGAVGVNTISSCTVTSQTGLTFGAVSTSASTATVLVTAPTCGTHYLLLSATLSSGETIKGTVRADVRSDQPNTQSSDYR